MTQKMFVADSVFKIQDLPVSGDYINIENEEYYRIANYDRMRPFFMTLVSHSDHWMFISSTGGLSAGRKNENSALFPYYTDDKIADSFETTGQKSIFRLVKDQKSYLWEPFSRRYEKLYKIRRNIYKSFLGNKILFEEINEDLKLSFQYSWQFSEKFGFVRKSKLTNHSNEKVKIDMLDGLQNILPFGVKSSMQNDKSNLVNAYKKSELEEKTGLGLILLSAIIVDKAEPSEALKATTVWSSGLEAEHYLLSDRQLAQFRNGQTLKTENSKKAEPGAYFINAQIDLSPGKNSQWQIVAELNQDHADVNNLIHDLTIRKSELLKEIEADIALGNEKLMKLVGSADGLQLTNDRLNHTRHYTNVLFNIMRGGIFDEDYSVHTVDFRKYVHALNNEVSKKNEAFLNELSGKLNYSILLKKCENTGDSDLLRFCYEYLPLTFSRRHGDPSRPWNKFSIETKKEDGSKNLDYQGNWRDIFQNWEALALSYPLFINSMISKFVNASTIDGYNAYRITRNGIDWEVIEPDDPWSNIGYWGDHQIIYLLKLLEISHRHKKDDLENLLEQRNFVFANVPYNIKSYKEILADPKDTIEFDQQRENAAEKKFAEIGSDGKLVYGENGQILKATLTEKLLLSLLTKLSNFIPEGGIWLNTQRPEWNDANNALVGNGISMVTLHYIRMYLNFCLQLFSDSKNDEFKLSTPLYDLLIEIQDCFKANHKFLSTKISDGTRKNIMNKLGLAGEAYRRKAYSAFKGSSLKKITKTELLNFLDITLQYVDHSIRANKRNDGLYHSYNLLEINGDQAKVNHLYEMLEGQVSILSSGILNTSEANALLDILKESKIYREDQQSYLLYPDRTLPDFLEKNNIPNEFIESSQLAQSLLKNGDKSVILSDVLGHYHFNGNFTNAKDLQKALNALKQLDYRALVEKEYQSYLEQFEKMFNHKAFTGRSGTFFGYEGLGSIYWHMVSKLLLAVQENIDLALSNSDQSLIEKLKTHYYDIREGIGVHKSPELYGAFPTDPYSHTPAHKGAQQPGMTGQVKEDIINRWAELGIRVNNGKLKFNPHFLKKEELLKKANSFEYYSINGNKETIDLEKGELAFTYCQLPIVYRMNVKSASIRIELQNGENLNINGSELPEEYSQEIFSRSGKIKRLRVGFNREL